MSSKPVRVWFARRRPGCLRWIAFCCISFTFCAGAGSYFTCKLASISRANFPEPILELHVSHVAQEEARGGGDVLEKRLPCDLSFYTFLHPSIRIVMLVSMHFSSCSRCAGKVASERRASSCKECECDAAECYPSQTSRASSSKPSK